MQDDPISWRCPACGYPNNSNEQYDISKCRDCGYSRSQQQPIVIVQKIIIDERKPIKRKSVKKKSIKKKVSKPKKKVKTSKLHIDNCNCPLHKNRRSISISKILNEPRKLGIKPSFLKDIKDIIKNLKTRKSK